VEVLTITIECSNGALFPAEVMKMAAPEKAAQLAAILADLGITFRVEDDEERIRFQADSERRVIVVGKRCLARLWVHAFASFSIFYDTVQLKTRDPAATLDLRTTDRLRKAATLLKWAVKADLTTKLFPQQLDHSGTLALPPELAVVFSEEEFAHDKHLADEHATTALGYILHHELAHLRLGHKAEHGLRSIEQEKAADRMAAEWLLDSSGLTPNDLLRRHLGIAIALGWLASISVYTGHSSGSSHPPAWDRLYQVFEQYLSSDDDQVWAFIMAVLGLHLENQRRSLVTPGRPCRSFKEGVNYYLDVISRIED
jgi:hypothetical protein